MNYPTGQTGKSIMFEELINIDKNLFSTINGAHSPFLDTLMYWISDKYIWIPFYIALLWILVRTFGKRTILILLFIVVLITITDQTGVLLFKNNFQRLRPCHDPELKNMVHLVREYCGGLYGFISNHAANTFALAVFTGIMLRQKYKWVLIFLLLWASLVSYSRIYLGVHYPADIIAGAIWGTMIAWVMHKLFRFAEKRINE